MNIEELQQLRSHLSGYVSIDDTAKLIALIDDKLAEIARQSATSEDVQAAIALEELKDSARDTQKAFYVGETGYGHEPAKSVVLTLPSFNTILAALRHAEPPKDNMHKEETESSFSSHTDCTNNPPAGDYDGAIQEMIREREGWKYIEGHDAPELLNFMNEKISLYDLAISCIEYAKGGATK